MIEIENLSRSFGQFTAVNNLSFKVKPGEVLGFLGPNGAGKSTTMRMITGYLKPDSGDISIFGHSVTASPLQTKSMVGYLPEGAPSYSDMSVRSFLTFIAKARGIPNAEREPRISSVIQQLQLGSVERRVIATLSKGFQRRAGLAQALISDPKVLILDEPTDGLDPNQKYEVRQLIRQLSSDKIVVISTHILEEVEALCNRVIIINDGQLVADGTPSQLKSYSKFYHSVELEVSDPEQWAIHLRSLDGVASISVSRDKANHLVIFPKRGVLLWPQLNVWLQHHDQQPDSISISSGRLEDVFQRVTMGESLAEFGAAREAFE